ncbi:MAG: hypothetical protein Q4B12_03300 [Bowdeniella nasicola]|nr:hypothetical protein [Bowdeniella nasicola]
MSDALYTAIPKATRLALTHREMELVASLHGLSLLHYGGPIALRDFPDYVVMKDAAMVLCEPAAAQTLAIAMSKYGWQTDPSECEFCTQMVHPERGLEALIFTQSPAVTGTWPSIFQALWRRHRIDRSGYPHLAVPDFWDHCALMLADLTRGFADNPQYARRNRLAVESKIPDTERTYFYQRLRELTLLDAVYPTGGATQSPAQRRRIAATSTPLPVSRRVATWFYRVADAPTTKLRLRSAFGRTPTKRERFLPGEEAIATPTSRIAPDIAWNLDDDGVTLLPLNAPAPVRLLGSARLVWQLLATGASDDELVDVITQEVSGVPPYADQQIRDVITQLTQMKLLAPPPEG